MEQNKTGTYKLAERILADARDLAEQTEMKANMSAMDIASESVEKCGDLRREFRRKREAAVQSVLDGSRTRALIDGRKAALKRKRVLIDSVFDRAYEALCALNPQRRSELCASLLRAETESGETIIPAAADRAVIEKILSDGTRVQAYPISIPQQFMFYMSAQYGASYPVITSVWHITFTVKLTKRKWKKPLMRRFFGAIQ